VEVFFANPRRYGLFGKKIDTEITDFISNNDVAKISDTEDFLLEGEPEILYNQIKKD
jgi:hypothetical protein